MAKKVTKKPAAKAPVERPVLVTTEHRGVYFGYLQSRDGQKVRLRAARACVYWTSDVKGYPGLAAVGPSDSCRVSPPFDVELLDATTIADVTPEAVVRWEAGPWK